MMYKWHTRFMELAQLVATWSKDPSTGVGAVIVDNHNRVVSLGYNGLPKGVRDSSERLQNREVKLAVTLHAEDNALGFANQDVSGFTMYVTRPPCSHCAARIIQRGISRVVTPTPSEDFLERWGDSIKLSEQLFDEAEVSIVYLPKEE